MHELDENSKEIEYEMRMSIRFPETLMDKLDSLLTCMDRLKKMEDYGLMDEGKIYDIRDNIVVEFIKEAFYPEPAI